MPKLIYQDPESGLENVLEMGPQLLEVTIGRNPGNELRVNNPSISRKHARISYDVQLGQCSISDLKSSNGTYVNGNRIQTQRLVDGDRIRVGEFPFDFVEGPEEIPVYGEPLQPEQGRSPTHLGGFHAPPPEPPVAPAYNPGTSGFGQQNPGTSGFGQQNPGISGFGQQNPGTSGFGQQNNPFSNPPRSGSFGPPPGQEPPSSPFGADPVSIYDPDADDNAGLPEVFLGDDSFDEVIESASAAFGDHELGSEATAFNFDDDEPPILDVLPVESDDDFDDGDFVFGGSAAAPPAAPMAPLASDDGDFAFAVREPSLTNVPGLTAPSVVEPRRVATTGPAAAVPKPAMSANIGATAPADPAEIAALSRELEELRARLDDAERDRQELQDTLDKSASEVSGASRLQLDRLRKERDRLSDERRNLMRQISELKRSLEEAPDPEHVAHIEQELSQSAEQINTLRSSLDEALGEVEDRDDQIGQQQRQLESLQQELSGLKTTYASTEESRQAADGEVSSLRQSEQSLQQELEALKQAHNELNESHDRAQAALEESRHYAESLEVSIKSRDERIAGLDEALETRGQEIHQRDERVDQLLMSLDEVRAENERLATRTSTLESELAARPVADDVRVLQDDVTQLTLKLREVTQHRDQLQQHSDTLQQELDAVRDEFARTKQRYSAVDEELDGLRRERETLKQEKVAFARETDYLQTERRKLTDQIAKLTERTDALEKDRKRKKHIFEELSSDLKRLVLEKDAVEGRAAQLEKALSGSPSQEDVVAREARIQELESQLRESREQLSELEQDTIRLTRDLGGVASERDQAIEKATSLEGDLEELQQRLGSLSEGQQEQEGAVSTLQQSLDDERAKRKELEEALEQAIQEVDALGALSQELEQAQATVASLEGKLAEAQEAAATAPAASGGGDSAALMEQLEELEEALSAVILERDELEQKVKSLGG